MDLMTTIVGLVALLVGFFVGFLIRSIAASYGSQKWRNEAQLVKEMIAGDPEHPYPAPLLVSHVLTAIRRSPDELSKRVRDVRRSLARGDVPEARVGEMAREAEDSR